MKNENKVTPVRNLCFFILHGWKWIVAAIVALAFVFGLAQGVANNNPVASEESITALDARIATQVAYLENSILMQLDPYNVYEATANLHITQNGACETDRIHKQSDADHQSSLHRRHFRRCAVYTNPGCRFPA